MIPLYLIIALLLTHINRAWIGERRVRIICIVILIITVIIFIKQMQLFDLLALYGGR